MCLKPSDMFPSNEPSQIPETWREVETYPYIDLEGKCAEKIRKESNTGKKSFAWRQPDGRGGWQYNRKGVGNVLYNHAALAETKSVFVVEGEKDVHTLAEHGKPAVCGADGAGPGKWRAEYTEQLRGLHVAVIPDNDDVGKAFAIETANALHGVATSVRVIDLTQIWPELPEHGDTTDIISHLGSAGVDLISQLARDVPIYVPGTLVHEAKEPVEGEPPALQITAAKDLMGMVFSPLIQAVDRLICEGLTMLVSASKIGKSWLVLLMAFCVARGEPFLDRRTTKCRVLYYALEDSERRLQQRMLTMGLTDVPDNLFFVTKAQMLDAGFESQLEGWLASKEGPALVIIDTLQKVRGTTKGGINAYQNDYEVIGKLKSLADKYRAMFVLVHHTNKAKFVADPFEKISGSTGIMGAADTAIIIERERGANTATVRYEGRDAWGADFVIRQEENCRWVLENSNANEYKAGRDYESDPLVQLFRKLITENPNGGRWTYTNLQALGREFLGYQPFIDGKDCALKLNDGLADEMRMRDNILVEYGVKTTGGRGIRLQQVSKIVAFPTKLQTDNE